MGTPVFESDRILAMIRRFHSFHDIYIIPYLTNFFNKKNIDNGFWLKFPIFIWNGAKMIDAQAVQEV